MTKLFGFNQYTHTLKTRMYENNKQIDPDKNRRLPFRWMTGKVQNIHTIHILLNS